MNKLVSVHLYYTVRYFRVTVLKNISDITFIAYDFIPLHSTSIFIKQCFEAIPSLRESIFVCVVVQVQEILLT